MNLLRHLFFTFFSLLLVGCGYQYQLSKGKLKAVSEQEIIPFHFEKDMIFLEVFVNGKKKRFILDSGAPNVIDDDLQKEFNFKEVYSTNFKDASNRSSKLVMVKIDKISFGAIEVKNTVAAVADFSQFSCYNIDGIIGTNIMSFFDWKIDYEQELATLYKSGIPADSLDSFGISIPFFSNLQKSPFFKLHLGNITFNKVEVDLGSNGGINLQKWNQFDLENYKEKYQIFGETSVGIHGPILDTTLVVEVDNVSFGDYPIPKTLITVKPTSTSKVGNRFLKNYDLLLSWSREAIYLKQNTPLEYDRDNEILYLGWKEGQLYVKAFTQDLSELVESGDRIIELDGKNTNQISEIDYCEIKSGNLKNIRLKIEKFRGHETIELLVDKVL